VNGGEEIKLRALEGILIEVKGVLVAMMILCVTVVRE